MSKNTGSIASSPTSWLRLYAVVAALPLALAACGGGGSPSPAPAPAPTPAPAPSPSLTIAPSATATTAGGTAITLTATVSNSTDTPSWTLSGPGSLSATTGATVQYLPPDPKTFNATATVNVSAALTGATTQTVSIALTPGIIAGLTWHNVAVTSIGNLQRVDYADGHYVAVSDQGGALASTDAATWSPVTVLSSSTATDHFNAMAIAHIGSTFVAAGSASAAPYSSARGAVATSTDGLTWSMATTPAITAPLHGLVAGPHFIALGETGHVYSSTDGRAWTAAATIAGAQAFNAGTYAAGKYVIVGDAGYIADSSDGITWAAGQVIVVGGAGVNLHGVAYDGSEFIAVGDNGLIATSTDGFSWTPRTSVLTGALRGVSVSSGGEIVVVGDTGIETSLDGITWTARDEDGAAALADVVFANSGFVAVGTASAIKTSTN